MVTSACSLGLESSRKRFLRRDGFFKGHSELDRPGMIPGEALFIKILKLIK